MKRPQPPHYRGIPALISWIDINLSTGTSNLYRQHFGIGITERRVMVEIATKKDISVKRICDIIGYDKGTVSRAVRRIESLGLAAVRVDEEDSRVRRISLTPAGRRMHRQLEAIALQRRNFLESIFTKKERNQLVSLLRRLHAHVPNVARFDPLQNHNKNRRRR